MGNPQDLIYWIKLGRKVEFPTKIRDIQEIAIALSAKSLNPKLLRQDWLRARGIVPQDWQLKQRPILNSSLAELNFQNSLKIVARGCTVTFIEIVGNKNLQEVNVPQIAQKFVKELPQLDYQTLQVSPRRLISLPGSLDAPRKYITETLMSPGSWQEFGHSPMQAAINFLYHLQRCQLRLNVREARLQKLGQPTITALFFSGYFQYNLANIPMPERLEQLQQRLDSWISDFETFNQLINQKFLG